MTIDLEPIKERLARLKAAIALPNPPCGDMSKAAAWVHAENAIRDHALHEVPALVAEVERLRQDLAKVTADLDNLRLLLDGYSATPAIGDRQ